jgi:hypothetical protein
MDELFRYQQLRQSQKLFEEQKRLVGLPLYSDGDYSPLANDLIDINKQADAEGAVDRRLEEYSRTAKVLEDPESLPPAVRAAYDWLNFKARPIKTDDFASFLSSLNPFEAFDLQEEWITYADNLLFAIYRGHASINYCIDFQLLIRICYLFHLCIVVSDNEVQATEGTSSELLNAILDNPVLLPALVLRSRCSGDCHEKGKVDFPRVPEIRGAIDEKACGCKCDESCQKPSGHCICINTYIADLFVIKEELARYEEGDVADIENILAGEFKVRRHRTLYRTESTS